METILSNESFSYSWLINIKPSVDSLGDSRRFSLDIQDGGSFIEMDPNLISMRWTSSVSEFEFGLPVSQSPVLVHADKIFADGLLLPLHQLTTPQKGEEVSASSESVFGRSLSLDSSKSLLSRSNRHQSRSCCILPSRAASSNSSPLFHSAQSTPISLSACSSKSFPPSRRAKAKLPFLKSCAKSPKKILSKYLCFLLPLYTKVKELRLVSSNSVQSFADSRQTSPRVSNALLSIDQYRGNAMFEIGSEKSIHDAVLYCKKSNVSSMQ